MGVEDETIVHPLNQNIIAAQLLTIDDHSYGDAEVHSSTAAHISLSTKNIVLVHDGWADLTKFYCNCTRTQHSHYVQTCHVIIQLQIMG